MLETVKELPPINEAQRKLTFFRQSGWMMMATMASGVLMSLMHVFSKYLSESEYSSFGTMLQVMNWISIPVCGLQTAIAQQMSAAVTETQRRQLMGTFWAILKGTFCLWLVLALIAAMGREHFDVTWKISNPASIWLMAAVGLTLLWQPIFLGLLQGRQNFLWYGWTSIFNGVGRICLGGLIVFCLGGWAAGLMVGVLAGQAFLLTIAIWQNRDLYGKSSLPFQARPWLRRMIPFTLGSGVSLFLLSTDVIVVHSHFKDDGPYVFAGTLARAIVIFTSPLAAVMFPKLVVSLVGNQKNNLLTLTLLGTVVLSAMAATGLPWVAPLLIRYGSKPEFVSIMPLMPLFAWSMVPLAAGNVLLGNLMAHSRFQCVPWLVTVAAGYWIALQHLHNSFKMVIEVMGTFNLLYLIVCLIFTWRGKSKSPIQI